MKRYLFSLCVIALSITNSYAIYKTSDFKNSPFLPNSIMDYGSNDVSKVVNALIGDTLIMSYSNYNYMFKNKEHIIEFEKLIPDTIVIKESKKPKLNKHYYLCYAMNGQRVEDIFFEDGSPFFKTPTFNYKKFIVKSLGGIDKHGRQTVNLYDIENNEDIIWHIDQSVETSSKGYVYKVKEYFSKNPISISICNSQIPEEFVPDLKFSATFGFDSRSKKCYVDNDSYISCKTTSKLVPKGYLIYYFKEGPYSVSDNKFLSEQELKKKQEEKFKAEQLAKEEAQKDSIFSFLYKEKGLAVNCLDDDSFLDISKANIFIYKIREESVWYDVWFIYHGKRYKETKFKEWPSELNEEQKAQFDYLLKRSFRGEDVRLANAKKYDKEEWNKQKQAAQAASRANAEKRAKLIEQLKNDNIFLLETHEAESTTRATGISFTIFNCFEKTIKYVYYSVCAVNSVGDVQEDHYGKAMFSDNEPGFIKPGDTKVIYNNKIFWDENYKISSVRLIALRFVFTDGSEKSYNSWTNIAPHFRETKL